MNQCGVILSLLLSAVFTLTEITAREAHWIEGEDYSQSSFNRHSWYQNRNVSKDLLSPGVGGVSDGEWHGHYSNSGSETVTARYSFEISEAGSYTCWIRLNPFSNRNGGANYSYRFDNVSFQPIDVSASQSPSDLIDPGIDIRFIDWVSLGTVELETGPHGLTIQLKRRPGETENRGGIDVISLVNFPWAPSGVLPPDPTPSIPEPDEWFALQVGPDAFSTDSIIDMRMLIEKPAGLHGALQRNGKDFAFEDGTPIRFWGAGASILDSVLSREEHAKFLTKHGINMVRLHPVQSELGVLIKNPTTGARYLNTDNLDRLDRWFAILKEHGVYMTWSMFYPHVITPDDGYPTELYQELPNKGVGKSSSGMVAFMQLLQDAEWAWAEALLNHVNPYTGLTYKDDPALAIVEVHNEDSIFWHAPLNNLTDGSLPKHQAILQSLWMEWLKNRYTNEANLRQAWGAGVLNGDSVNNPSMKIYGAWEMEADGPVFNKTREQKRLGDFIRFLAETQRDYYQRRKQQIRDAGFKGVIISTAWKAGGAAADSANLWTDDAMDAIDRHNYFGGGAGNHNIIEGSVNNATHLDRPGRGILSVGLYQVEDKPFTVTEWTQKPPNQWKAEIAPLFAFYGMGLQGWDASFHFHSSRSFMGNGWPSLRSYVTATPHYIAQFPALAFAIYNNHFQEGDIVAARRLETDEIFNGIDALSQDFSGGGYDENEPSGNLETPTEILAIGRVTAKIADGLDHSYSADWDQYWDSFRRTVTSNTGQLTWDYGNRLVKVHSEKTQGVIGFAGGHGIELPAVHFDIRTPFVSLLFTPLDNQPLIHSEHILITALAQDKQTGAVYNAGGTQLIEAGGPPLLLEPVRAHIKLKGAPIQTIKVVDLYGVPTDQEVESEDNGFTIDGRYATYYYEIKRVIPRLTVQLDSSNSTVTLSWPTLIEEYILKETDELNGDWKNSNLQSVSHGEVNAASFKAPESTRFFRLEKPE